MEHREESWERVRPTLLECVISTYGLGDSSVSSSCYQLLSSLLEHYCGILINQCCCRCDKKGFIRCHQCGLNQLLCGDCDIDVHNSLLHDREMWNNFCFQAIPPTTTCNDVGLPIMIGKNLITQVLFLHGSYFSKQFMLHFNQTNQCLARHHHHVQDVKLRVP